MNFKKLTLAVLTVAATGALAGPAQAAIIDDENIRLTATGYDFGGSTWGLGAPTGSGGLHFHHDSGQIRPHLVGTMHLNDADGTCGRMKLEHYDVRGNFLSSEYGGERCVDDDRHHEFTVDLNGYANSQIDDVTVRLQRRTASGWQNMASDTVHVGTSGDNVLINEDGVDFGHEFLYFGQPQAGGMTWGLLEGRVTPHLLGAIHLNNSSGVCARVNLRYLTEGGIHLRSEPSREVCADDNSRHSWGIDMQPYASTRIERVTVQLQTQGSNGSWNTAGEHTVSIGL